MSVEKTFGHFFKPEVRSQGAELLADNSVVLSQGGDTQIEGYVKASQMAKVSFRAESIDSKSFAVDCSCSSSSRGQLCKHIWGMLLKVEASSPDFLSSKNDIEKVEGLSKRSSKATAKPAVSAEREASAAAMKTRQSDYRKAQYQKQKARVKELKGGKKAAKQSKFSEAPSYSGAVEDALKYFADNGFPIEYPIDEEAVGNAKRILSRIFHPDKGGTHQEIVDLNHHSEVLLNEV